MVTTSTPRCSRCLDKIRGESRRTPLGDLVCTSCSDQINGLVLGGLSSGVGGAVTGPSILRWVRESLSAKRDDDAQDELRDDGARS